MTRPISLVIIDEIENLAIKCALAEGAIAAGEWRNAIVGVCLTDGKVTCIDAPDSHQWLIGHLNAKLGRPFDWRWDEPLGPHMHERIGELIKKELERRKRERNCCEYASVLIPRHNRVADIGTRPRRKGVSVSSRCSARASVSLVFDHSKQPAARCIRAEMIER